MDVPFYEQPDFNPGGVQSRPDNRRYQWSEIGANSAPFDWSTEVDVEAKVAQAIGAPLFKIPIKAQNGSGSCGGQAWSYLAEIQEALATGTFEERSAKYVYSQTFWPNGGGSVGSDNAAIYSRQGVAREALLTSYDAGLPPSEAFMERPMDITDAMRVDAKTDRAYPYASVATNIDSAAQAIRDNGGIILLISGSNNGTWGSSTPTAPKPGDIVWRHFICAIKAKMLNGKKAICFLNSWGGAVGENGQQWLTEDYFNASPAPILEVWTHVYNQNPPTTGFTHNFATNIKYGDNSGEVVALQTALQLQGFFPSTLPATGYFGTITSAAVLAFQVHYKVAPMSELLSLNGKLVGVATRGQLNSLYNK